MPKRPFYAQGLRFSCTRCSSCCRFEPGFVFLTGQDLDRLAGKLDMVREEFIAVYCRWVPVFEAPEKGPDKKGGGDIFQLSLKEKSNYDCIFWKGGCGVYDARPRQCGTFPFWPSILSSRGVWDGFAQHCPGIGKGELHNGEYIHSCLKDRLSEAIVTNVEGI
jgi:Fe-S-cluster containining protein